MNACPMLKYVKVGDTIDKNQLERILPASYPSDGDAKFIQRWYPKPL